MGILGKKAFEKKCSNLFYGLNPVNVLRRRSIYGSPCRKQSFFGGKKQKNIR